ncbi:MAG: YmdB family metallophosphoesterase [Treponema sp.]|jgi:metallophosphoesterase (TIGR00282 family)|nr:YmdB family metallophosphoesterase [Treponema sp.]
METLGIIMIGDVVGEPGLDVLERTLPGLIQTHAADFVIVNGENAAAGFGMTKGVLTRILDAGADAVTSGNHVWEKRDFWPVMDENKRILRPANYPAGVPGLGWNRFEKAGLSWIVINLQGREFMTAIDCPFKTFDALAAQAGEGSIILVDFHAESTREKESLAYYVDGRAHLVAGTHTHIQTADERILPQGTGYITDMGMTGVLEGILGMDPKICLDRARTQVLYRMECAGPAADRPPALQGIAAKLDRDTRRTLSLTRIHTV